MSKHTPGPWVAVARTNAHVEIEAPDQLGYLAKKVATCSLTNHEANARLIEAAPNLLAKLKEIVSQIDQGGTDGKVFARDHCITAARAAIAEATGGDRRCQLCGYQHGHAIGCRNNPVDQALAGIAAAGGEAA